MTTFPHAEPSTKRFTPRDPLDKAIMFAISLLIASKNRLAELVAAGKLSEEDYYLHAVKTEDDVITLMTGGSIRIGPEDDPNAIVANWNEDNKVTAMAGMTMENILEKIYGETGAYNV